MDPDSANACLPYKLMELVTSQVTKTTFISVAFTACTYYEPNTAIKNSKVNFLKPDTIVVKVNNAAAPKKKKKTIYLTFDDGPNKGTKNMMNIVQKEEIPVTLFIIGQHVYGAKSKLLYLTALLTATFLKLQTTALPTPFKISMPGFTGCRIVLWKILNDVQTALT